MKIVVEFGEYKIENDVEKGSPRRNRCRTAILLSLCKTHGYCLSLASLSSELGLSVFMKVVDVDVIFHYPF